MNVFIKACNHSLKLPKKKDTFALNRIGMDITVIYLFIILAIASIPALIDQITMADYGVQIQLFFKLIYFFIFYYLVLVVLVFSGLSVFAYIMTITARLLDRKLTYAIMWKMSAFAITIPVFVFTILSFFYPLTFLFVFLALAYMTFVMIKIILIYPKRRK